VNLSFSTSTATSADISIINTVVPVSKLPMCPLDLEAHNLGRYEEENAPAGILFRSGLLVIWNRTPSLLLSQSLSALSLRFSSQRADPSLQPQILPRFPLARPYLWHAQHCVIESLVDHLNPGSAVGGESQRKWEPFVFEYVNDYFYFPFFLPEDRTMHHPILKLILIPPNSLSNPKVKYVLAKLVTSEGERRYTPQFSYSAFFHRVLLRATQTPGELAKHSYGEAVSSTQTMFHKCVSPNHVRRTAH
jgi:biotin--protein ligase